MAIYDGSTTWFPLPYHLIASVEDGDDTVKFDRLNEADLIAKYRPGLSTDFTEHEWRLYTVLQARCNNRGHSAVISNRFLEHFTALDAKRLRLARGKLEDRGIIRTEQLPSKREHRYWILGRDKQTFSGGTVWTKEMREGSATESRKAASKAKKAAEDEDTWGGM